MLNLSDIKINHKINKKDFKSFEILNNVNASSQERLIRIILLLFTMLVVILLLPWTQNVRAKGELIALSPDQRPQTIQTVIAGKIEKWYVQEGQLVMKGDTILKITEVKDDYFDPALLENTANQIEAKGFSRNSYGEKVSALESQVSALVKERELKLNQSNNKILQTVLKLQADSIDLEAAKTNNNIATDQYNRFKTLYDDGLRSLTELETRKLQFQKTQADLLNKQNAYLSTKNELLNNKIELNRIDAEYKDKISKSNADKYTALSGLYDTDANINKLQNQYSNYEVRASMYYILAPQDGFITQAKKTGIGELLKEGEEILSIMPKKYDIGVQMYIKPIDLPLFEKGQRVMMQFDGWPAIIFAGWPGISYGTFEGKVLAIDNFISPNNLYRVIVKPSKDSYPWPEQLRVGTGVSAISMLKRVQVWYEIWRQINGFPPDYYKSNLIKDNNLNK